MGFQRKKTYFCWLLFLSTFANYRIAFLCFLGYRLFNDFMCFAFGRWSFTLWKKTKNIHISECKIFIYFAQKNLLFSILHTYFYKTHILVYLFAHLCNKIFIPLQFFIILSLTDPTLSHRPNTQKKVAVVFIGVRAPLFLSASGSGGPVIKMASLLGLVFLCSY